MLLCLNIENTRITAALFEGETLRGKGCLAAGTARTADEYAVLLEGLLRLRGFSSLDIDGAILCSAVPTLTASIKEAVRLGFGVIPLVVGPGVKSGLPIRTEHPTELGADLVAAAVGGLLITEPPMLICSLDTASTIAYLDEKGNFSGVMIAAGIETSLSALRAACEQLPAVGVEEPRMLFGKNTAESMRSGALFGAAAMIDGVYERAAREESSRKSLSLLLTGAFASAIAPLCESPAREEENLIFLGLREIWNKNIKDNQM